MSDIPQPESRKEKGIYEVFYISILLKGLNAFLEIILGGALLLPIHIDDLMRALVENELIEDPGDAVAGFMQHLLPYLSPHAQFYGALYLLGHGIVKGVLVVGLLRNKLWAYPASLVVFSLFILYQVVRWFSTHSLMLVALTIFDLVVMWLIYHEYRRMTSMRT